MLRLLSLSCRPRGLARARAQETTTLMMRVHDFSSSVAAVETEEEDTRMPSIGPPAPPGYMSHLRNIGISAHIDSGKTTLTERILFYTGKINAIHDVRGKDGVGAKMDSMDLEREKGITIQSAATYCKWGSNDINIIDTPGHVDFTIEVERALRVLDGGILVLCGVAGVQSQSLTVDRQMKRYSVPRIAFINKLDRMGANPWKVIDGVRTQLKLNAAAVQVPIHLEEHMEGVVCLLTMQAIRNVGDQGEHLAYGGREDIPDEVWTEAQLKRHELIERLAEVDDDIATLFLEEIEPSIDELRQAIRRTTLDHTFVPVFMGSAYKNKGVQPLLKGVIDYLPNPTEASNYAHDQARDEAVTCVPCAPDNMLLALAFKLEEGRFGQLTYMRLYSGTLRKGDVVYNMSTGRKIKVPRLVKMHSNEMEDVVEARAGEVIAMFGVDCASMDTFSNVAKNTMTLTSLHVPEAVMSLAIRPIDQAMLPNFSKSLNRFTKEDPTFRVSKDQESKETIISGMGELHLEIYLERMKREYNVECTSGAPQVNYRETIRRRAPFNYLHKKQSGGSGQYARVTGYIDVNVEEEEDNDDETTLQPTKSNTFVNEIIGNAIPPEFIMACEKGAKDAVKKGWLVGHPIEGLRICLTDGQHHAVDSSELAFRSAMVQAIRQAFHNAKPVVLEPVMTVEVDIPTEFQGNIIAEINRRRGLILNSESDDVSTTVHCDVPLQNMFGFSTDLRSATQGKGEFSMEFRSHAPVTRDIQEKLMAEYQAQVLAAQEAKK